MLTTISLMLAIFFMADRNLLPAVVTIANQRTVGLINNIINDSLLNTITAHDLSSEDFFTVSTDENGRISSLSVNTILVNQVAGALAVDISEGMLAEEMMGIDVPIGLFSGIQIFAGLGPTYRVNVVPAGDAIVEYETSFTSAGINQVNFQVWLNVETQMRVVVPLQDVVVTVNRRVPLVNTVFAGEVPPGMLPIMTFD